MPGRKTPLVNNQIYHILNKSISLQPIFTTAKNCKRAIQLIRYYQNKTPPIRYSQFILLSNKKREEILKNLVKQKQFLIEIIVFCLMPNHFHFILKQTTENGISKFMSNFANSYTRYFNVKNTRNGPLFQGKFKAVRVENEEQFLHLSRYIHLNPYSSHVIKTLEKLIKYPYSSLPEYLGNSQMSFCNKKLVLNQFKSLKSYKNFLFDRANYQRKLEKIKHLTLEE